MSVCRHYAERPRATAHYWDRVDEDVGIYADSRLDAFHGCGDLIVVVIWRALL